MFSHISTKGKFAIFIEICIGGSNTSNKPILKYDKHIQ